MPPGEGWLTSGASSFPPTCCDRSLELFPTRFEDEWRAGRQYGTPQALNDAFRAFAGRIGPDDEAALAEAFEAASYRLEVDAVDGGVVAMAALARAGFRIGLVSDTSLAGGRHLRGYLESHGLLDHIGHCSFSDEVGVYKPDAAIFRDCLAGSERRRPGRGRARR